MFKIKLLLYAETFELVVELWIPTNGCAACFEAHVVCCYCCCLLVVF